MGDNYNDCVEEVDKSYARWIEECNIADCIAQAHADHEPNFAFCETLPVAQKDVCIREVTDSLEQQTSECYPPPPTCREKAVSHYEEAQAYCFTISDDTA